MASGGKVLDTATSVTSAASREASRQASAIAARTAARPDGIGEADVAMMINTILPDIH
jgi:hypothetical protein